MVVSGYDPVQGYIALWTGILEIHIQSGTQFVKLHHIF